MILISIFYSFFSKCGSLATRTCLALHIQILLLNVFRLFFETDNNQNVVSSHSESQWRRTGLNSVGASIDTTSGRGRKRGTLICIISGWGRKTVGASAPTAPIGSAPLIITYPILSRPNITHSSINRFTFMNTWALLSETR